jgi:hypothetical protein
VNDDIGENNDPDKGPHSLNKKCGYERIMHVDIEEHNEPYNEPCPQSILTHSKTTTRNDIPVNVYIVNQNDTDNRSCPALNANILEND